jgi:hypothetical protein
MYRYLDSLRTMDEVWALEAAHHGLDPEGSTQLRHVFYAGAAAMLMLITNAADDDEDPEEIFARLADELTEFGRSVLVPD